MRHEVGRLQGQTDTEDNMFRIALTAMAFIIASPALAAGPDLKDQKAEVKAAKTYSKQVDKAVSKWQKGNEKGNANKMAKADADLDGIINTELRRLRREGIPTVVELPPELPEPNRFVKGEQVPLRELAETNNEYRLSWLRYQAEHAPPAPEFPAKESYRDSLVELRDLSDKAQRGKASPAELRRMSRLLNTLDGQVEKRYERADARYERAKG
jgi:hypothetical protein